MTHRLGNIGNRGKEEPFKMKGNKGSRRAEAIDGVFDKSLAIDSDGQIPAPPFISIKHTDAPTNDINLSMVTTGSTEERVDHRKRRAPVAANGHPPREVAPG